MEDAAAEPPTMDPFQECQEQMRNFEINDRPPSFRHSRAFRNFKNPPQPHMCIRDTTSDGDQEVLINVMSWTRIVKPQTPNDPIPLYGGMRVLASSSSNGSNNNNNRSPAAPQQWPPQPAMLFAVMANPEVLKKASRNSVDDQDLTALVELMCEFVEAMNPGLKLLRQPVVLKDRDLSGELKNIWGAVQAKRETERDQFMTGGKHSNSSNNHNANLVVYTELGPDSSVVGFSQEAQEMDEEAKHMNNNGRTNYGPESESRGGDNASNNNHIVIDSTECTVTADQEEESRSSRRTDPVSSNDGPEDKATISSIDDDDDREPMTQNSHNNNSNLNHKNTDKGGDVRTFKDGDENVVPRDGSMGETEEERAEIDSNGLSDSFNSTHKNNNDKQEMIQVTTPIPVPVVADPVVVVNKNPKSTSIPVPMLTKSSNTNNSGKAEKEVANVKEKKDKSISGFLQSSGLFGKRNRDKDKDRDRESSLVGATKDKSSSRVKLGSFKSKLLLGGSREKEDKGTDANAKKIPIPPIGGGVGVGAGEETNNSHFSEIGQSLTTAKC